MHTYTDTNEHTHNFTDEHGNIYKVGVSVGAWEDALELLENPPAPPLRPHYTIPNTSIRLGIETTDRDAFNAQLALLKLAFDEQYITNDSEVQFYDADGTTVHTVTFAQYKGVMLQYGLYMQSLAFA